MVALACGIHFGARSAGAHLVGVVSGVGLMMLILLSGAQALIEAVPVLSQGLRWFGVAWLFWLGVQLARSSDLLNRFTRGRMSGIVEREGEIALVQDGERVQPISGGDRALVRVALHLALVELALRAGAPPALLRLGGDLPLIDASALRPLLIHLVE
jgi:hypothetical protein